jgi:hypothetical protein
MLYNTQMVGASPIRNLPVVPRKRFRQVTTRSLGRSNGWGLDPFFSLVGFWTMGEGWHGGGGGESDNYDDDDDKRRLLMP